MKNNDKYKYIMIVFVIFIISHLIWKIQNTQNLSQMDGETTSFDFYLATKPSNCYYQAWRGMSFLLKNCQNLEYGRKYTVTGTVKPETAKNLFSTKTLMVRDIKSVLEKDDSVFDFWSKKMADVSGILEQWRGQIVERAIPYFNSQNSLLPVSLTLGSKAAVLDPDFKAQVVEIGIAHLLAVSGSHLVTIVALLELPLKRLPIRLLTIFLLLSLLFYTWLIGSGASIVRATLMTSFALIYRNILHKQFLPLFGLFISVLLMLAYNPYFLTDVGFLLSVAATFGIILLMNNQRQSRNLNQSTRLLAVEQEPKNTLKPVKDLILTSLVAQLFVTPITIAAFGQLNLVGVVATMILNPLIEPLMVLTIVFYVCLGASVLTGGFLEAILTVLASTIDYLSDIFSKIVTWIAQWPITTREINSEIAVYVWIFYYLCLLILLLPRRQHRLELRYA